MISSSLITGFVELPKKQTCDYDGKKLTESQVKKGRSASEEGTVLCRESWAKSPSLSTQIVCWSLWPWAERMQRTPHTVCKNHGQPWRLRRAQLLQRTCLERFLHTTNLCKFIFINSVFLKNKGITLLESQGRSFNKNEAHNTTGEKNRGRAK